MSQKNRTYLAVGGHSWGLGESPKDAKRRCRRYSSRGERLSVYLLPEGATDVRVSQLGHAIWRRPGAENPGELEHVSGPDRR